MLEQPRMATTPYGEPKVAQDVNKTQDAGLRDMKGLKDMKGLFQGAQTLCPPIHREALSPLP